MTAAVRGNHDHAVAQRIPVRKMTGLSRLARQARPTHWELLNHSQLNFLARLPVTRRVELDGLKFYLVHATPRDPFDEYLRDDEEGWLARLESVEADFICVGHSHQPFCLDLGDRKVINPGSVGQPRDGYPRASYFVIDDGQVTFHRVEYDIEATIQNLSENGIAGEVLEMAAHFLRTGGRMLP